MNNLAVVKAHELFVSLVDGIPSDMLPDGLKQRDKHEPGRRQKLAYELAYARIIYKHFRWQKEKIRQWMEFNYPFRKAEKIPLPDDWWENDDAIAELIKLVQKMYLHGIQLVEDDVLIGIDYSLFNARAADYARDYVGLLIKNINDTTLESVRSTLSAFVETPGMTIGDTMDMLPFDTQRSMRVATTEITRAYGKASLDAGLELKKTYPDVRVTKTWFTNADDRTCELCGPLDGIEVDIDDQFPGGVDGPPLHVNCILAGNFIDSLGNISTMTKSLYNGRCVEICVSDGSSIAVTQNHPILTDRGWVLAKDINITDNLICTINGERITGLVNPNNNQRPAIIEEVFTSFKKHFSMRSISVPTAAEYFHGDGKSIDGNIEIINTNRLLPRNTNAAFLHPFSQLTFISRGLSAKPFHGLCSEGFFFPCCDSPASSDMGISEHSASLIVSSAIPSNKHRIGNIARFYSGINDALPHSPAIDTSLAREFIFRFSGNIASKKAIKIRNFNFSGHVYDLQSEPYNLFSVNGIITHNCRCWIQTRTRI